MSTARNRNDGPPASVDRDEHLTPQGKRKQRTHNGPSPHDIRRNDANLLHNLASLCDRDDGWLRIVRPRDSDTLYLKWKYTQGKHAGYYVMACVQYWQVSYGLELLVDKLDAVAAGAHRPTKDSPHNPD